MGTSFEVIDLTGDDISPAAPVSGTTDTRIFENHRSGVRSAKADGTSETSPLKRPHEEASVEGGITVAADDNHNDDHPECNPTPKKRWRGLALTTVKTTVRAASDLQTLPNAERIIQASLSSNASPKANSHLQQAPTVVVSSGIRQLSLAPGHAPSPSKESSNESKYEPSHSSRESYESWFPPASPSSSRSQRKDPSGLSDDEEDEKDQDDEEHWEIERSKSPKHFTPSPGPSQRLFDAQDLPLLGFRGYSGATFGLNSRNGFCAGAFMDDDEVPVCLCITDRYYRDEAERHVSMDRSRPTPFISLTKNPIRAIGRAFGAGRTLFTNPRLAIINLLVLKDTGLLQQAEDLQLQPKVTYDARGEFLIWGEITKSAIVSVIDVADLLNRPPSTSIDEDVFAFQYLKQTWGGYFVRHELYNKQIQLSYWTGVALGRFLSMLDLPEYCHECAITAIVRDFAFKIKKSEQWQENEIFCNGIKEGLRRGVPDQRVLPPIETTSDAHAKIHNIAEVETDIETFHSPIPDSDSDSSATITGQEGNIADPGNTSLDAIMTDYDDGLLQSTETQEADVLRGLPGAYELEMELEGATAVENRKFSSLIDCRSCQATLRVDMLVSIQHDL